MENNRLALVRERANRLQNKYGLTVPIDLDVIVREKNITVKYEENQVGIDGLCRLQDDPPTIILNAEITYEPRRRFTLAHEIGHVCIPWHTGVDTCFLDNPFYSFHGQQMINTQELEANVFASELLLPTDWLLRTYDFDTYDLSGIIQDICNTAQISTLACFYALKNVLPPGDIVLIKLEYENYWRRFCNPAIEQFFAPGLNIMEFYDSVCCWKGSFKISRYQVLHYKMLPPPEFSVINQTFKEFSGNFEDLLMALSGGYPLRIMPYIQEIINSLDEKFFVVLQIGDSYQRHYQHPATVIRMHIAQRDIESLFQYLQNNFEEYGRLNLSPDSCLLWVKECWRGERVSPVQSNPHKLLKKIVADLYPPKEAMRMLQRINGIMASLNQRYPMATLNAMCHYARIRFQTDSSFKEFAAHDQFEEYIAGKAQSMIDRRRFFDFE